MKDFKNKIEEITGNESNQWKEEARFYRDNKWLQYSSEIAFRILALIENDEELNQTKLAKVLNISRQQISKIVKGKENLTLETIYKLSKALQFELISFPPYKDNFFLGRKYLPPPVKSIGNSYRGLASVKEGAAKAMVNQNDSVVVELKSIAS